MFITAPVPAGAAEADAENGAPAVERQAAALAQAYGAVVGVKAVAVSDARSNEILGRLRLGSGVVIDGEGLVLTIGYLILEADEVDLVLRNGRSVPASVVGYDTATGFGVVRALAPLRIEPARLGRSAAMRDDDPLLVVGVGGASLARLVSKRPFSASWEYQVEDALFTAPARPDHSGAALFNADGELLGIGSLLVADALGDGGDAARLAGNMFVPIDLLVPILAELREHGSSSRSRRAWLGLNCVEVGGQLRVARVSTDGPAAAAGLRPGDRIVAIDGRPVAALAPFYQVLWRGSPPEREVTLDVRRNGETLRLTLHAVDRMKMLRRPVGV